MGLLKIYRKFYAITFPLNEEEVYNLINPVEINIKSYISGSGNTQTNILVEDGVEVIKEENGIYYAKLNQNLYSSDYDYDLVWLVKYTPSAPIKKLVTRFRIKPYNITSIIDYEISSKIIECEIDNGIIEYEILKNI